MKNIAKNVIWQIFLHFRFALLNHYLRSIGKKNAVFIWIPKSAGSSVFEILHKNGCPKLKHIQLVKYSFPQKGLVTFGHMDYKKLVKNGYISEKFNKSSFKFCFSRNPYDRAVSLYFYLKKTNRIDQNWSFLSFCRYLRQHGCEKIGLYNRHGLSQCNPQVKWIEGIHMDYCGKVEHIQKDLLKVLDALELPASKVLHLNITRHQKYRDYYCNESKQIVEEFYEKDFRFFNYNPQHL
jgi:hypothetical protein